MTQMCAAPTVCTCVFHCRRLPVTPARTVLRRADSPMPASTAAKTFGRVDLMEEAGARVALAETARNNKARFEKASFSFV